MGAVNTVEQMTAVQFVAARVPDHGRPWNLVGGEVVVNEPTRVHARVQSNILVALELWTRQAAGRGCAGLPIDIGLDDRNVFAPDVHWYREERVPANDAVPPYAMADLAVEVRSPSTWRYDIGAKKSAYERHGLRELWLVDTVAETVLIYRRSKSDSARFDLSLELEAGAKLTSPLLRGFGVPVAEIFVAR